MKNTVPVTASISASTEIRTVRDICRVWSGFSFRQRVTNDPSGDIAVVQMKDLRDDYSAIASDDLTWVEGTDIGPQHYLAQGDVLFIAKGANNFATVYNLDLPRAVAASAFFVLRPDHSMVYPPYLAWWINQKPAQEYLKQNMAGTYIPNITRPTVENIVVPLPPIEHQRSIADLDLLTRAEKRIQEQLVAKRHELIERLLLSTLKTN